jgi:choline dehydrogenase
VDRVLVEDGHARGIRLAESGEAIAADRVILAAGAYGSPAILLRSGLGPASHLRALGIAVLEDLPGVGQNLIDHPLLGLRYTAPPRVATEDMPFFQTLLTGRSTKAQGIGDLHILPSAVAAEASGGSAAFTLFVSLMKPLSRGKLGLRSADPAAAPAVDLGYFGHPDDMPRMLEVVGIARQLSRTAPLSDLVVEEDYPGSHVPDTAADLQRAILGQVETYHHPVGTCRMGSASDSGAVVDAHGSVHAVKGLSIVDASIMPTIPAANTNLPTIMIAERCAAWLRQD